MNIGLWAQVVVFTHILLYWIVWDMLCIPGRAPRTKETLPDFRE